MFHMNQNMKVVLAVEPVDLRKSFNGLYAIARNELGETPEDGSLFIFSNRTRTRIKVLCFDGTGCWVSVKRLEEGTFVSVRPITPSRSPDLSSMLRE